MEVTPKDMSLRNRRLYLLRDQSAESSFSGSFGPADFPIFKIGARRQTGISNANDYCSVP
jgi:hypothetical protein